MIVKLKPRLPSRLVTRFAPSPTGYLHLGHVASAIFVWGIGRALGAEIILRIEDHDRSRCRKEYEQAILEDLKWLGFIADRGVANVAEPSEYRQSDCLKHYELALDSLAKATSVYVCECSRKDIAQILPTPIFGEEQCYPGTCRTKKIPMIGDCAVRAELPDTTISFDDGLMGNQVQNPAHQCGDILLRDRHGQWTYQFAVVADDIRHNVNLVIRGKDLIHSTGRQIQLAQFLGRKDLPFFYHHPLLIDDDGQKLSKRILSECVGKRRSAGEDPRVVIGEAAFLCGLTAKNKILSSDECQNLFSVSPSI